MTKSRQTTLLWFQPDSLGKLLYLRDRGRTEVGGFGITPGR